MAYILLVSATVVEGEFEWDADKAAANVEKHGVTFEEAMGVFFDPNAAELPDLAHPDRFNIIGFSARSRLLFVVAVERGERTRIISARKATKAEACTYEEG